MYAIRAAGPDGPVTLEQIPAPRPAPGEVLLAVHAVALTAGELAWPERHPRGKVVLAARPEPSWTDEAPP